MNCKDPHYHIISYDCALHGVFHFGLSFSCELSMMDGIIASVPKLTLAHKHTNGINKK